MITDILYMQNYGKKLNKMNLNKEKTVTAIGKLLRFKKRSSFYNFPLQEATANKRYGKIGVEMEVLKCAAK